MIGVYLRTARYYRLSQIAARLRFSVESALRKKVPQLGLHRYKVPKGLSRNESAAFFPAKISGHELGRESENVARLKRGIFRFLNSEKLLGFPVNWNPAETTRLWRYNLHYFEYALDLALVAAWQNDVASAELLERLFTDWIHANPVGEDVGWHSYPIARRIVNWIQAFSLATPEKIFRESEKESLWLGSLYQQARYLEDHLEIDVLGNHLLANGKALVFAGLFCGGEAGARWFNIGQQILWRGLEDQIHSDGGHQERSPMYHAIVLQDYLEVMLAYRLNGKQISNSVRDRLILMADFLDGIRHPDGEIPLFGDAAFGIAHLPADILAAAGRLLNVPSRWQNQEPRIYCALLAPEVPGKKQDAASYQPPSEWPETGYVKLAGATAADAMIIDTKPLGPPHLPAHGHCSLFSYELSIGDRRVVVDSGVEEYQPGPWREFWRSTRAHNTVLVDGAEQSEIWGSFRAGQRVRVLESSCGRSMGASVFMGAHAGFAGQQRPTPHRRIAAALPGGLWIVLDEITGKGIHTVESFVHLVPEAECLIGESFATISLESIHLRLYPYFAPGAKVPIVSSVCGSINPIQGFCAEEFGKRKPNTVLSFSYTADLPARLGYLIAPSHFPIASWNINRITSDQETQIDFEIQSPLGDKGYRIAIPR